MDDRTHGPGDLSGSRPNVWHQPTTMKHVGTDRTSPMEEVEPITSEDEFETALGHETECGVN